MSEHEHHQRPRLVRHADVAVVGGSAAGLAAALQLGRQRRSVIVVDAGDPRNAPAAHMHGYLGHEGLPPAEFAAVGREEVRSYGAEVVPGRVVAARRGDHGGFELELTGGHRVSARRVLAATGVVDELPAIEGLAEHWGHDVVHCPFCHGYEVRDRRVALIVTHAMALHPAVLFRQLTDRLTLVLHDEIAADHPEVVALEAAGVRVVPEQARRVVTGDGGRPTAIELASGAAIAVDAIAVAPRFRPRVEPFVDLGVRTVPHPSGLGEVVEVDAMGETSVPGLYAAGNVTDPGLQVLHAAAHGNRVGAMISMALAHEDVEAAARPSANEADWDHRYSGDRIWSGNPNGSLVVEVSGLAPGTVLDVGAGEGGDAIWLAERGWTVTASDVSGRALDRIEQTARDRGLAVEVLRADANALDPFGGRRFDLVSAQYASIPRTADARGVHNMLDAVAVGGTLVVVGHDLAPMRTPVDTSTHSRPFDPDAYVRVDDVAAVVVPSPDWEVEVHATRPRPPGAASGHHVDDVVLRARRLR